MLGYRVISYRGMSGSIRTEDAKVPPLKVGVNYRRLAGGGRLILWGRFLTIVSNN